MKQGLITVSQLQDTCQPTGPQVLLRDARLAGAVYQLNWQAMVENDVMLRHLEAY